MTTTTKKEEEFEEKKGEEEEEKGRKERSASKVKKTELYSSLDATTIEIFFTEEDVAMEKEEVSHRFIFDSEGSRDPVGIEIKAGREEEKFTFDLRKHHPVRTDPEFVRVRCGKKKIEVKLMKKKNQKREEEETYSLFKSSTHLPYYTLFFFFFLNTQTRHIK